MSHKYTPLSIKRQHNLGIRESSILTKLALRIFKVEYRLCVLIFWLCRKPYTAIRYVIQLPELLRADAFAKHWSNINADQVKSPRNVGSRNPLVEYIEDYGEGPGVFKWNHYLDIYHQYLQKFIDQGMSVNQWYDLTKINGKVLDSNRVKRDILTAYKYGLKSLYYIRSKDRENISETITTNKVTLGDDIEMNDIPINTEMACEDGACAI